MKRLRITTPPAPAAGGTRPGRTGEGAPRGQAAEGARPGPAAGDARSRRGRPTQGRYAGLAGACGLALLVAGCGTSMGSTSPATAASSGAGQASPPAGSVTALSPATQKALAAKYLAVAQPANHSLDAENDGYGDAEHDDLAAARKDLLDEAATEARFDSQLLAIKFPAAIEQQVQTLVSANKIRIQLTQRQARATTLASLRAFDSQHKAADAAVEAPVRQIRRLLALPPPSTS